MKTVYRDKPVCYQVLYWPSRIGPRVRRVHETLFTSPVFNRCMDANRFANNVRSSGGAVLFVEGLYREHDGALEDWNAFENKYLKKSRGVK